jgi:regulator of replication initiation timing
MAKQAAVRTADTVDLEPIDRLEEKIRLLVGMVTQLRGEQAKAADENARLAQEIVALRARVADAEGADAEIVALRDERDLIRTRVGDMLAQLEGLSI